MILTSSLSNLEFSVFLQLILNNLSSLFLSTSHKDEKQRAACAEAYGSCAAKHLPLVLDKVSNFKIVFL